jgi:acyl-CoA hydrolase
MQNIDNKLVSVEEAISKIGHHFNIVTSMAAAEPTKFFNHIHGRLKELDGVEIHCANPTKSYSCFSDPGLQGKVKINVMFLTSVVRQTDAASYVQYVPQHLSQWVRNITESKKINVFWGSCTEPDKRGYVSLGPGACYEPEILRKADLVVLEINRNLPTTYGATTIHTSDIDCFIENHHELPEIGKSEITEVDRKIGHQISELVDDGSTLQLGIGAIPDAIAAALESKKNLGIHTEMINDTMMQLAIKGVVNGKEKSLWPNKIVGAFAYGSKELYEFIDQNPMVELQPASVVNDPYRIGRNHKMTSINTAVEIDITGQVCSESIGHVEISGVGGASETHIGAQRAKQGRGIVAIRSTAKGGKMSKIVFELKPGSKVSISRNDIDTVVTEYGVVRLRGLSTSERVRALISIAHPDFRDELTRKSEEVGYI